MTKDHYSTYKNKKVLITGHTGFKGSWLAFWLNELGAQVTGFALPPAYENSLFEILNLEGIVSHRPGDIRDIRELLKVMEEVQPDFVFHLAAQAIVKESYSDPLTTYSTNVLGSANVLEAVRHCPSVKSLVYITSDKCYLNKEWNWGYRETDELGGVDPYSASKACAEMVFRSYFLAYFKSRPHFGCASTRAGNVIGGGDWAADRIVPDIIRALKSNASISLRAPHATRPWQHVLDPLNGYLSLGHQLYHKPKEIHGMSFNFGPSGESIRTVLDLTNAILSCWKNENFNISYETQKIHEATLLHLSIDQAKAYLDWSPKLSFDTAAIHTGEWYYRIMNQENPISLTREQIRNFMNE